MCLSLQHDQLQRLREVPQLQQLNEERDVDHDTPTSATSAYTDPRDTPTTKPRTGLSRPPPPVSAQTKQSQVAANKETPRTSRRQIAEDLHYTRSVAKNLRRIIPSDSSTDNGTPGSTSGENGAQD